MFLLAPLLAVTAAALVGLLYQAAGSARDARRFPPPGQLIDIGGHRLHIQISGSGGPAVILEAGIAASSLSWQPLHDEIAKFTTVCSYDRAGLGWSEPSGQPLTLDAIHSGLQALLERAGVDGPVVLVGHSFGGLAALEFACRHRERVAGLVLVDPLPASEWRDASPAELAKLRYGIRLARRGEWLTRLGVVRVSLDMLRAGSRRIPKLAAKVSSGSGSQLAGRLVGEVRKLPPELWPVVQAHWCQPKSFRSMAEHLAALPANAAACRSGCDLGDLPLIVLSGAKSADDRSADHRLMAALSSRGRMITAQNSGHWIQLDEPELVVSSVREVLAQVPAGPDSRTGAA